MESLDEIYNDLIMEHSMNSSNKKSLINVIIAKWDIIQTVEMK